MIYSRERETQYQKPELELQHKIDKEIAFAAGAEFFDNRDPLYHISEYFTNTFDMAGMRLGSQLSAEQQGQRGKDQPGQSPTQGRERQFVRETSMDKYWQPSPLRTDQHFLSRFCETAFQRGTLASAVFRGTGQMMLFTCLKRTIGQSQPKNARQRMLFEGGSVTKNMSGHPTKAVFNRGTADSAVGMVADVTRDARRLTEALTAMAEGKNVLPDNSGTNTLRLVYPFLSDEKDRKLLAGYEAQLKALSGKENTEASQAILKRAIAKTQALIERKRFMKTQFIMKLREIGDNAQSALQTFSDPGFSAAVAQTLAPQADSGGDDEDKQE